MIDFNEELANFRPAAEPDISGGAGSKIDAKTDAAADLADVLFEMTKLLKKQAE